MKKFLLFFLVICFNVNFAQNFIDTLDVVPGQTFLLPNNSLPFLTKETIKFNFKVEIKDDNNSFVSNDKYDIIEKLQVPKKIKVTEGRGEQVVFGAKILFKETGTYIVTLRSTRYSKPLGYGAYNAIIKKFLIHVNYPTLAVPFNIDESYSINENFSFSFATNEFTDPTKYSYIIKDEEGEINITGNSAFVKLDTILQHDENYGKTITITGMYDGKPFDYKDENNEPKQTKWKFYINEPPSSLSYKSDWEYIDEKNTSKETPVLNINNPYVKYLAFYYENEITAFAPEIEEAEIKSTPSDFLRSDNYNFIDSIKTDQFPFIYFSLDVNPDFWNDKEISKPYPVVLEIKLTTQFREEKIKFRANIINIKSRNK